MHLHSLLPCLALAAALAAPAAAGASEISLAGDDLVFRAAPGERNNVSVLEGPGGPGTVRFGDIGSTIAFPAGACEASPLGWTDCRAGGAVRVELGDGDDRFTLGTSSRVSNPVTVSGGAGDDELKGDEVNPVATVLAGDEGADRLTGGRGDDELHGGPGADTLDGHAGRDRLFGGDGDDTLDGDRFQQDAADLLDGGAGTDTAEGWTHPERDTHPPVSVTLDGRPNDGRPGEGDDVRAIERFSAHVSGTWDLSDAAEVVNAWSNLDEGPSQVLARGGDDRLTGGSHAETLDGGAGADRVEGGFGNDTLVGGPGPDQLFGDKTSSQCGLWESCALPVGNDVIDARDGEADTVDCGVGADRALVDAVDTVAASCEEVVRGGGAPMASPDPAATSAPARSEPRPRLAGSARRRGGRVTVAGRLTLPSGVAASACGGGKVSVVLATKAGRTLSRGTARLSRTCTYRVTVPTRGRRGLLKLTVRFAGTARLAAAPARTMNVR
jgi:hypothetical protein